MRFETVFSNGDFERAKTAETTSGMVAAAAYEGLFATLAFHDSVLKPLAQAASLRTPREECLVGSYYRIVAFLQSTRQICGPHHFQTLSSMARTVFEVGVDIALVLSDPTNKKAEMMAAFTRCERLRLARRRVEYYRTHPVPGDFEIADDQALVSNTAEATAVDALKAAHWGGHRPENWYGKNTPDRATEAGGIWMDRYLQHFGTLSWHVHGGLAGVGGITPDVANGTCGQAYLLIANVALDSYAGIADTLRWKDAIGDFDAKLSFLRQVNALWITDLHLESLGERRRFDFLDAAERERWKLTAPQDGPTEVM